MFLFADAIAMIRAIRAKGGLISLWGFALNIPQIIGGLLFIWRPEGAAILIVEVVALMIAGQIHKRDPFSRLTGLCHLPWLVLLPWLLMRLGDPDHGVIFTLWLAYTALTIAVSLIFDVADVVRWLRGDRRFSWS